MALDLMVIDATGEGGGDNAGFAPVVPPPKSRSGGGLATTLFTRTHLHAVAGVSIRRDAFQRVLAECRDRVIATYMKPLNELVSDGIDYNPFERPILAKDSHAYSHATLMRCFDASSQGTLSPNTKKDIYEAMFPECKHLSSAVAEVNRITTAITGTFASKELVGNEIYTKERIHQTLRVAANWIETCVQAPLNKILNDPYSGNVLETECYLSLDDGLTYNRSSFDSIHTPVARGGGGVVQYDKDNNDVTLDGRVIGRRHRRLEGCGDILRSLTPLTTIIDEYMASGDFATTTGIV
jgi:hypothetical protein